MAGLTLNPKGLLGTVAKRQKTQSSQLQALGMDDPYKKKKKKKKENEGGTFRYFMDKFIGNKEKKNNSIAK